MDKRKPIGRNANNNPLNIRRNEILRIGLRPEQTDPDYFQFRNPAWGYRAAFVMLRVYRHKLRVRTIRELADNWRVHRDEFEKDIYIRQVAVLSGLKPEEPVDESRPAMLIGLVRALGRVETGSGQRTEDVRAGWLLYQG